MTVDSYKFLPKSFRAGYEGTPMQESEAVWTPLEKPAGEATVALVTSAGIYLKASQEPFDVEREKREPTWGDPTYRVIPRTTQQSEIDDVIAKIESLTEDSEPSEMLTALRQMATTVKGREAAQQSVLHEVQARLAAKDEADKKRDNCKRLCNANAFSKARTVGNGPLNCRNSCDNTGYVD